MWTPNDGDAWWDLAGDYFRKLAIDGSASDGFGVAPPPGGDPRRVPHPLAAFRQAIRLTGRWQNISEKMFIYASGCDATPFASTYESLKGDEAWIVKSLPTGHNVIVEAPSDFLRLVGELKSVRVK